MRLSNPHRFHRILSAGSFILEGIRALVLCSCRGSGKSGGLGFLPVSLCPCGVSVPPTPPPTVSLLHLFVHSSYPSTKEYSSELHGRRVVWWCVYFTKEPPGGEAARRRESGAPESAWAWRMEGWRMEGWRRLSSCLRQRRLDISDKNRRCEGILMGMPMDSKQKHRERKCMCLCVWVFGNCIYYIGRPKIYFFLLKWACFCDMMHFFTKEPRLGL